MKVEFLEIRERLIEALKEKVRFIDNELDFCLVEGFLSLNIYEDFNRLGTRMIPAVGIVGKKSGRIYTFALKALLPDVEI